MYVEHPYKFNDKFYAKVDGKFHEITREVAKAMLSAYRNEILVIWKWVRSLKRIRITEWMYSTIIRIV